MISFLCENVFEMTQGTHEQCDDTTKIFEIRCTAATSFFFVLCSSPARRVGPSAWEMAGAEPLVVSQHIPSTSCLHSPGEQPLHRTATCTVQEMPKEHLLKAA